MSQNYSRSGGLLLSARRVGMLAGLCATAIPLIPVEWYWLGGLFWLGIAYLIWQDHDTVLAVHLIVDFFLFRAILAGQYANAIPY